MSLFAVFSKTFNDRRFSFDAANLEEAISLGKGWALYHGFCFREMLEVKPVDSKVNDYGQNDFHPEYVR